MSDSKNIHTYYTSIDYVQGESYFLMYYDDTGNKADTNYYIVDTYLCKEISDNINTFIRKSNDTDKPDIKGDLKFIIDTQELVFSLGFYIDDDDDDKALIIRLIETNVRETINIIAKQILEGKFVKFGQNYNMFDYRVSKYDAKNNRYYVLVGVRKYIQDSDD